MPACGQAVPVVFEGVTEVAINSLMWADGIGFLTVTGFNGLTSEITLKNTCPQLCDSVTQLAPGTPIPACVLWVVGPPQCPQTAGDQSGIFLTSGFIAPAVSGCVQITVTNTAGLSANQNVGILAGIYLIQSIASTTLMTICNEGSGITPGIDVEPRDSSQNLIVPIVPISVNPCSLTSSTQGSLIVCSSDQMRPLGGLVDGQIPVLIDHTTNEVEFRTLAIPTIICTILTSSLVLDNSNPPGTTYLALVADTSSFTAGQIVIIGSRHFSVDTVVGPTQIRLLPIPDPTSVENYPVNSALCSADVETRLDTLEDYVFHNNASCGTQWLDAEANLADAAAFTPALIAPAGTAAGNEGSITFTNLSCINVMAVHYTIDYAWSYEVKGLATETAQVSLKGEYVADPNPVAPLGTVYSAPKSHVFTTISGGTAGVNRYADTSSFSNVVAIAPGGSVTIRGKASLLYDFGNLTTGVNVVALVTHVSYLGVAIK